MITSFDGPYRFLSNFWPVNVELDGEIYPSVEHAYQAAKTTDATARGIICLASTAGKAKKLGLRVVMRSDWDQVKISVMHYLLQQKFAQYELKQLLLKTKGHVLVEGNWWNDTFWGVYKGKGSNHLGKLLMEIRDAYLTTETVETETAR